MDRTSTPFPRPPNSSSNSSNSNDGGHKAKRPHREKTTRIFKVDEVVEGDEDKWHLKRLQGEPQDFLVIFNCKARAQRLEQARIVVDNLKIIGKEPMAYIAKLSVDGTAYRAWRLTKSFTTLKGSVTFCNKSEPIMGSSECREPTTEWKIIWQREKDPTGTWYVSRESIRIITRLRNIVCVHGNHKCTKKRDSSSGARDSFRYKCPVRVLSPDGSQLCNEGEVMRRFHDNTYAVLLNHNHEVVRVCSKLLQQISGDSDHDDNDNMRDEFTAVDDSDARSRNENSNENDSAVSERSRVDGLVDITDLSISNSHPTVDYFNNANDDDGDDDYHNDGNDMDAADDDSGHPSLYPDILSLNLDDSDVLEFQPYSSSFLHAMHASPPALDGVFTQPHVDSPPSTRDSSPPVQPPDHLPYLGDNHSMVMDNNDNDYYYDNGEKGISNPTLIKQ